MKRMEIIKLNFRVTNEKTLDDIFKDAKIEILEIAEDYGFGNAHLEINIQKHEICNIYNLQTKKNRKVK